jgi:hypothetical protein
MEPTTFLIAFTIWYIIGFIGCVFSITRVSNFTINDLFFSLMVSVCGLFIISFILIKECGDVVVFKKRIK